MKITRRGSIVLTSVLIAASIILFVAAGKLVQQTVKAGVDTDKKVVVGTTAETPKVSRKTIFENVFVTIIFCGDRKPIEAPQTTVTTAKPEEPVATIKNNCGNIQRKKPPEKVIILPPSKEKPKPEPCPSPTTTTTTCPKPTTTTTIPNPKPKAPENSKPETTFHHPQNPATQPVQDNKSELVKPTPGYIPGTAEKQAHPPQGKNTTNPNLDSGTGTAPPGVDLSTGQQGGNAGGVSSPTENPKATIETKPAPPPPAP